MSCEEMPTLEDFAQMYVDRGGYGKITDVDELTSAIVGGHFGSGGPRGFRWDTFGRHVTIYAGRDHGEKGLRTVLARWTSREIAEAALGLTAPQGRLL